jgi:predicted Zn-dependent peptidase
MAYNSSMARGWESKAVEAQMDAAQADKAAQQTPALTLHDREQRARKQSLLLSRSRIVSLLELARNERYRAQLKRTLEHLDEQLRELEKAEGS